MSKSEMETLLKEHGEYQAVLSTWTDGSLVPLENKYTELREHVDSFKVTSPVSRTIP